MAFFNKGLSLLARYIVGIILIVGVGAPVRIVNQTMFGIYLFRNRIENIPFAGAPANSESDVPYPCLAFLFFCLQVISVPQPSAVFFGRNIPISFEHIDAPDESAGTQILIDRAVCLGIESQMILLRIRIHLEGFVQITVVTGMNPEAASIRLQNRQSRLPEDTTFPG